MSDEVVLNLADGWSLRSGAEDREAGEWVRICDENGVEVHYWDNQEWADEPILVMGAIINAAIQGFEGERIPCEDNCPLANTDNCKGYHYD